MSYKFTPKTDKQIAEEGLAPDGKYPFEIIKAAAEVSKKGAGSPMLHVKLKLFAEDGGTPYIEVYLMDSFAKLQKQFFYCIGMAAEYDSGDIPDEQVVVGRTGYAMIGTQKGKEKDNQPGEFWPDRNCVKSFLLPDAKDAPVEKQRFTKTEEGLPDGDSSIPF